MKKRKSASAKASRALARTKPIPLHAQHQLEQSPDGSLLRLLGRDGQVCLSIEITDRGPILRFEGAALRLQAAGELSIEAENLSLAARKNISLAAGGEMHLAAAGDMTSEARIQTISATRGNVNVKANDDVRLNGERVMVNCVET